MVKQSRTSSYSVGMQQMHQAIANHSGDPSLLSLLVKQSPSLSDTRSYKNFVHPRKDSSKDSVASDSTQEPEYVNSSVGFDSTRECNISGASSEDDSTQAAINMPANFALAWKTAAKAGSWKHQEPKGYKSPQKPATATTSGSKNTRSTLRGLDFLEAQINTHEAIVEEIGSIHRGAGLKPNRITNARVGPGPCAGWDAPEHGHCAEDIPLPRFMVPSIAPTFERPQGASATGALPVGLQSMAPPQMTQYIAPPPGLSLPCEDSSDDLHQMQWSYIARNPVKAQIPRQQGAPIRFSC